MIRLLIILLLITQFVLAQDYYVLQVKGIVKKTKSGAVVKTKDVIKADEQLTFTTSTDAIAVVNPKVGRFIIKPGKPTQTNELIAYVKDALSQASSRLSTRSGGFNNTLDFKVFFDKPLLLLPELTYKINGQSFPINDGSFFFIQYLFNGEEINKQLKVNSDSLLIINREDLFKIDGKSISGEAIKDFQLLYFTASGTSVICSIQFTLAELALVKGEIQVLKDALHTSGTSEVQILNEVIAYLNENYGKVDEANLRKWLNQ